MKGRKQSLVKAINKWKSSCHPIKWKLSTLSNANYFLNLLAALTDINNTSCLLGFREWGMGDVLTFPLCFSN